VVKAGAWITLHRFRNYDIFSKTCEQHTTAMRDPLSRNLIFIHGLISSGQGFKGNLLRRLFPDILTPDFEGPLGDRMARLASILSGGSSWTIIGSSFGGLMGAIFTAQHSQQVKKLIMLAPALIWPDFAQALPPPVSVPAVVYHGLRDEVIPLELVRPLAEQVFLNLSFHAVDDDHGLRITMQAIDWPTLVGDG
jgi:pimeloyl-ACP methyl ester carboxylesterase